MDIIGNFYSDEELLNTNVEATTNGKELIVKRSLGNDIDLGSGSNLQTYNFISGKIYLKLVLSKIDFTINKESIYTFRILDENN